MSLPLRHRLKRLAVVLLFLELVYLLGANLFLNSAAAGRWIHRKPGRLVVQWARGWTVFPGVVHLRDVRLRG